MEVLLALSERAQWGPCASTLAPSAGGAEMWESKLRMPQVLRKVIPSGKSKFSFGKEVERIHDFLIATNDKIIPNTVCFFEGEQ